MDVRGKHILKAQVKSSLIFQSYFRLKLNSLPRYINHLLSLKIFLGSAYHWHLAQSNCGLNYHLAVKTYPPPPPQKTKTLIFYCLYCIVCIVSVSFLKATPFLTLVKGLVFENFSIMKKRCHYWRCLFCISFLPDWLTKRKQGVEIPFSNTLKAVKNSTITCWTIKTRI